VQKDEIEDSADWQTDADRPSELSLRWSEESIRKRFAKDTRVSVSCNYHAFRFQIAESGGCFRRQEN